MYTLLIIVAVVIAFYAILYLIAASRPKIARLERPVVIDRPVETVFPEVASLQNFVTWSPWSGKDPSMTQAFTGEDGAVGSVYSWHGNRKVGKGSMTIRAIDPGKRVDIDLVFGFNKSAVAFVVEPQGHQTKVIWSFQSDMGEKMLMRLFQPAMKKFIGKDFEAGLANLKKKIEN